MGGSNLQAAAYGNGRWVVVGDRALLTSTDGLTWESLPVSGSGGLRHVIFAGGQFVAAGDNLILTSTDGKTWTSRLTGNKNLPAPVGVAYGNGAYVVLTASSVHRAEDGVWSARAP